MFGDQWIVRPVSRLLRQELSQLGSHHQAHCRPKVQGGLRGCSGSAQTSLPRLRGQCTTAQVALHFPGQCLRAPLTSEHVWNASFTNV